MNIRRHIEIQGFNDPDNGLPYQNNKNFARVMRFSDGQTVVSIGCTCPNCGDRGTGHWIDAKQWAEFSHKVTNAFFEALKEE